MGFGKVTGHLVRVTSLEPNKTETTEAGVELENEVGHRAHKSVLEVLL